MTRKKAGATRRRVRSADWQAKLTRSLTLQDGTKLVTLADGRTVLIRYFSTVIEDRAVALAIERLLKAAKTGAFADRKAATDQVAIVLRARAVY
jgi:hypothetical protein